MIKKPVKNAGAIILALLIAGCASDTRSGQGKGSQSTRPSQDSPADRQDQRQQEQRQQEQRKQDLQQHEMERGDLGATKTVLAVQWARGLDTCRPPLIPVKEKGKACR
jgi:hypothetical protein